MANFSASLGGTAIYLRASDTVLAGVPLVQIGAKGWRSGRPRIVAVDTNDARLLEGTLLLPAGTKDNMIAAVAALNAKLLAGTTLALQSKDETGSVTFVVHPSQPISPELASRSWDASKETPIPISWLVDPFATGAEQTLVNAVGTSYPNVVDLTVPGDLPTPLQLTFSGTGLHSIYCGLLPAQTPALTALLWQAHDQSWSGGTPSAVVDAATYSGYREQNTGTFSNASLTDTTLPGGTYKMVARIASSAIGTLAMYVDGCTNYPAVGAGTSYLLWDFTSMRIPYLGVRSSGVSTIPISMAASGATPYWDYVAAVPQSWGWAHWHPSSGSATASALVHDYDGQWYTSNIADAVNGFSGGLLAVGAQRLVVIADAAHGSGAGSITLTTTVKVVPRYAMWS